MKHGAIWLGVMLCLTASAAMEERRSGQVVVRFHPTDTAMAEQVMASVDRVRQAIRDDLGIAFRDPAVIVLARGAEDFRRWAGDNIPGWAVAIARARGHGVVIDVARTGRRLQNNLLFTLHHELVHLALGQVEREAGAAFPLWFHEGVATWVSGTAHFTDRRALLIAGAHGELIPFEELERRFPAEADRARLAYLQSAAFIKWLAGQGAPPGRLVAAFRETGDFDTAFRRAAGRPPARAEATWAASLKSPHPWLTTLFYSLSLITLIALAVIPAYLIVRLRRARRKRAMDEEEAWMDSLPDSEWGERED